MTKVTYIPPDPMSPASIEWNGVTFHANIPVELDPIKHSYMVLEVDRWVDEKTGEIRSKGKEKRKSMIEIAKGNPSFQVEGEAPVAVRKAGRPRVPKTSEEYRSHAQAWIAAAEHPEDLEERWTDEEDLRGRCQVGDDDLSYIRPFFEAKHHELKKQAA